MNHQKAFRILGIGNKSKEEDIKRAYKKLAVKWHPDKNQDKKEEAEAEFKQISEAYQFLMNNDIRQPQFMSAPDLYNHFFGTTNVGRGMNKSNVSVSFSSNMGGMRVQSYSKSTQTIIKDGKVFTRETETKNGQTTVREYEHGTNERIN